jgi:hypothetical protein
MKIISKPSLPSITMESQGILITRQYTTHFQVSKLPKLFLLLPSRRNNKIKQQIKVRKRAKMSQRKRIAQPKRKRY